MATSFVGLGERPIGTITCDGCGATWSDGVAETDGEGLIHRRAYEKAGWRLRRPNAYQAVEVCPGCARSNVD
ncbi:hypothetical protein GCM10022252_75150 [Streptosporangium oxazolinicum]|uniref:Uncharacterized protein n=1 Tax=Streptosporangium oxazolinicum TaxID=909287 RepID=A0ABP8BLN9_9ACTN